MTLRAAKTADYVKIVSRLHSVGTQKSPEIHDHPVGWEYSSLMRCFLLHILTSVEIMLKLYQDSPDYFPVTNAYILLRSMFELNITARYISQDPRRRSTAYIDYGCVLSRRRFEKHLKHRNTKREEWRDLVRAMLSYEFNPKRRQEISQNYEKVRQKFEFVDKKGRVRQFPNWANKSLRQMANEVDHDLEYDLLYSKYSDITHGTVRLADRFLKIRHRRMSWSTGSQEPDVAFLFRDVGGILSCFLLLLGRQFRLQLDEDIKKCWTDDIDYIYIG